MSSFEKLFAELVANAVNAALKNVAAAPKAAETTKVVSHKAKSAVSEAPKTAKAPKEHKKHASRAKGKWTIKTLAELTKGQFVKVALADGKNVYGNFTEKVKVAKGVYTMNVNTTKGCVAVETKAVKQINAYVK